MLATSTRQQNDDIGKRLLPDSYFCLLLKLFYLSYPYFSLISDIPGGFLFQYSFFFIRVLLTYSVM